MIRAEILRQPWPRIARLNIDTTQGLKAQAWPRILFSLQPLLIKSFIDEERLSELAFIGREEIHKILNSEAIRSCAT